MQHVNERVATLEANHDALDGRVTNLERHEETQTAILLSMNKDIGYIKAYVQMVEGRINWIVRIFQNPKTRYPTIGGLAGSALLLLIELKNRGII